MVWWIGSTSVNSLHLPIQRPPGDKRASSGTRSMSLQQRRMNVRVACSIPELSIGSMRIMGLYKKSGSRTVAVAAGICETLYPKARARSQK
jgi:hypothetical protein